MGEKFFDGLNHGEMENNTNAAVKLPGPGNAGWTTGWFEIDIMLTGQSEPPCCGGQHLLSLMSNSARQAGPYDPELPHGRPLEQWLRLDFGARDNYVQPVIYQRDDDRPTFQLGGRVSLAFRDQWARLRVEWEQHEDHVIFTINGSERRADIASGLLPIGNLLFVGNMDQYWGTGEGERCKDVGYQPCGMTGRVWYANLRYGR
jgi:hypothetical protein